MWELCVGFMAAASCIINYQDFGNRNIDADGNRTASFSHNCVFLSSLVARMGNKASTALVGLMWGMVYGYHFTISQLFPEAVMLNILNIMVTILISARFCRLIYRLTEKRNYHLFHSDLLTAATCIWEIVLAGVVLTNLLLKYCI